jgi:hypothetical protein
MSTATAQAAALREQLDANPVLGGPAATKAYANVDMAAHAAWSQRHNRIAKTGVEASGTVVSAVKTGASTISPGNDEMDIEVSLTSGPGAPRTMTVHESAVNATATFTPGDPIHLKIDPTNLDDAIMWFQTPVGPDVRMAKLEQIAAMHTAGGLTDEQFESMKAKIIASD